MLPIEKKRKPCCASCGCCKDKCGKEECCPAQSVCKLIESVALQEAGLAHILNAEGEKLQKAVRLACTVDDLLCVNKSVVKTINSVTQLEQVLLAKLQAAVELGEQPCCDPPCVEND